MTLYVESNFVLEIALGQEELVAAERLVAGAESGVIQIAIPSFAVSEPFSRVTRGIRDRETFLRQYNGHVRQLARSSPHRLDVGVLEAVPAALDRINDREADRLAETVARLFSTIRPIEFAVSSFHEARGFQLRLNLPIEDAVILASVLADLRASSRRDQYIFANRNRKDFDNPLIIAALQDLGCDLVWTFEEAAARLGVI